MDHPDALNLLRHHVMNYPGSNAASISLPNPGKHVHFKAELLQGIRAGDVWLNKIRYDENGKRIYGNVCLEVYLPSRGTCLLQHINLGACETSDIPKAFADGMFELCELHARTGVGESGEYLSPEVDRQVGLGMLGLANLLRRYGVSYAAFGEGLDRVNADITEYSNQKMKLLGNLRKELNELSDC